MESRITARETPHYATIDQTPDMYLQKENLDTGLNTKNVQKRAHTIERIRLPPHSVIRKQRKTQIA